MRVAYAFLCGLLVASAAHYCANFQRSSTSGVDGFFYMDISLGHAMYEFSLDTSQFSTPCDLSRGMTWHIHSYWNNYSSDSSSHTFCSSSYTGGHYDPNLACGPSSQESAGLCAKLGRISSNGYVYHCNTTNFALGKYGSCEVGDLSGKFGRVYPAKDSNQVFAFQSSIDYLPPYVADYGISWYSVVFHCFDGSRLLCAKIDETEGKCSDSDSTIQDNQSCSSSKSIWNPLSQGFLISSIILCIILFVILFYYCYQRFRTIKEPLTLQ